MKKLITLILSIWFISSVVLGQHAFIPEFQFGSFDKINLISGNITNIGSTHTKFGASDFGPGGILYAIDEWDNGFYTVDTTNGTVTLLGTNPPPEDHIWTGMAYDEETGIMYAASYHDVYEDFYSSLYTINVSNGAYTLLGSQVLAPSIGCIGIDGLGDMYALQLGNPAKLFKLDKTNGSVISYQGSLGYWAGGSSHGMDWSHEEQAMYLTSDEYMGLDNTLSIIDLTNATTTFVGDLGIGNWIGTIATAPILTADFSANTTDLCMGGTVNFTDESRWATSWSWTFEGGTPATSTDQNPSVTYNNTGIYDVTLEVSNGVITNTLYINDMIIVRDIPVQPDTPSGPTEVCGNEEYTYTTNSVQWATTYLWEVLPADAGIITGTDTSAIFESADDWSGNYTIKVMDSNDCGSSSWSSELSCILNFTPQPFLLEGGGSYCEGGVGRELTLDGSESDVDYELFIDDVSTGNILAGTGNPLNFGFQTDEGLYTVTAYSTDCSTDMYGQAYVYLIYAPPAGTQPTGPQEVCNNTTTDYQTTPISDADTLIWVLSPLEAGIIIGSGENISIEWEENFYGLAYLSVYGSNDCGDGPISDELEINVLQSPEPEVSGETFVCINNEIIYTTTNNQGSTYSWEIEGGNIVNGSGTNEITILWTTVGSAFIIVTETSAETCEGISDTLFVTVDACVGINEINNETLNLFPNPAKDIINIVFVSERNTKYEISIYNQFNQLVYKSQNINNEKEKHQVNINSLSGGVYFIKLITSSNRIYQSKFIVLK